MILALFIFQVNNDLDLNSHFININFKNTNEFKMATILYLKIVSSKY
jgi:hypothetical protein